MKNRIEQFTKTLNGGPAGTAPESVGSQPHASATGTSNVVQQLERGISRHPVLAVSLGLCAGVALGWLIKRR